MSVQAIQMELIKKIAHIQNEKLLDRVKAFLQRVEEEEELGQSPKPALSELEANLLIKINEGLPEELQQQYNELLTKSVQENLSQKEQEELAKLIPIVESQMVERMRYLVELAKLWEITLDELMDRLGIKPPPVIHV